MMGSKSNKYVTALLAVQFFQTESKFSNFDGQNALFPKFNRPLARLQKGKKILDAIIAAHPFLLFRANVLVYRVPTSSGNHRKPRKSLKKVPCMESHGI